ncbi:glycosyltransferase family 90 protein [Plenodomus tracheiphilus IPT5]|uniref:Glycosyltransferase family 90 protein n=1 Tax=Plenodomus tracheiphilus IPT5 TaxID=1408161 RepID=A0A6A7AWZ7_9PLEO|nr:glycosyltransferase family 90 protein [Plenodomus tracheiphilus IPT5]
MQVLLVGWPVVGVFRILFLGMLKAVSWSTISRTAKYTSWHIGPAVNTVAYLYTLDPFQQPTLVRALFPIVAGLLALAQAIHVVPTNNKHRYCLWVFSIVYMVPYCVHFSRVRAASLDANYTYRTCDNHPVAKLIGDAKADFEALLQGQSTSLQATKAEHRRRYGHDPPPVTDEFDIIGQLLAPFRGLSGLQLTNVTEKAFEEPGSELWLCKQFDRHISIMFNDPLDDMKGILPDVNFLVNHLDEPRVLLPAIPYGENMEPFKLTDMAHQHTWDTLTSLCAPSNESARNYLTTSELPFINSLASSQDLCEHSEYRNTHGFHHSPTSFRLFSGLVSVLPTGAASTMGGILILSPAYIEDEFRFDETKDIPWIQKTNELSETSFLDRRLYDVAFTRVFQCDRKHCWDQTAYFRTKSWTDKFRALQSRFAFDYQLLASRSVPLKQTLLGEWHDDRLRPWVHYVPVSQSMEELPELVSYLTSSECGQRQAKDIAEQDRQWFSRALRDVDMIIYLYRLLLELARLQDPGSEAER